MADWPTHADREPLQDRVARPSGGWQLHDAHRHRIRSRRVHGLAAYRRKLKIMTDVQFLGSMAFLLMGCKSFKVGAEEGLIRYYLAGLALVAVSVWYTVGVWTSHPL